MQKRNQQGKCWPSCSFEGVHLLFNLNCLADQHSAGSSTAQKSSKSSTQRLEPSQAAASVSSVPPLSVPHTQQSSASALSLCPLRTGYRPTAIQVRLISY